MTAENQAEAMAEAIVDANWRIRKLTIRLEALVGFPAMIVGLLLMWSDSAPLLVTVPLILSPFTVVIANAVRLHVVQRRRPRAAILWIRRFHRGKRATDEQAWLEARVLDWGQLITLADTSVDSDAFTRIMRSMLSPFTSLKPVYTVGLVVAVALVAWLAESDVVGWMSGTFGGLIALRLGLGLSRNKSTEIEVRHPYSGVTNVVEKARSSSLFRLGRCVVLRCPVDGDLWRQVVSELSESVDAAIVSAPEGSAQLHWEIQVLASRLGVRKMIALTTTSEPGIKDPPLGGMRVIEVPRKIRWWWLGEKRMVKPTDVAIGSAILAGRTGDAPVVEI